MCIHKDMICTASYGSFINVFFVASALSPPLYLARGQPGSSLKLSGNVKCYSCCLCWYFYVCIIMYGLMYRHILKFRRAGLDPDFIVKVWNFTLFYPVWKRTILGWSLHVWGPARRHVVRPLSDIFKSSPLHDPIMTGLLTFLEGKMGSDVHETIVQMCDKMLRFSLYYLSTARPKFLTRAQISADRARKLGLAVGMCRLMSYDII